MALSCCCRADFLLGFLRHLGNALGCVVIELFGLTIGDQAAFDGGFSYGSPDRAGGRPDYQRTGTNCQPGPEIAAVHAIVKQCHRRPPPLCPPPFYISPDFLQPVLASPAS